MTLTKPDSLRAAHLDAILDSYCLHGSPEENLIDLLTDAQHWCLLNDESFAALLATAQMHCAAETKTDSALALNGPEPHVLLASGLRTARDTLQELAQRTSDFSLQHNVWITFADFQALNEQEAALKALAQLVGSFNQEAFLAEQIRQAEEYLDWMNARAEVQAN